MSTYIWIGLAGCLGAMARYSLGAFIAARLGTAFPWGTFCINVSGSLLLGFLATLGQGASPLPPSLRAAATIGFLGAYTTFSTWSLETLRLAQAGSYGLALWNVGGSVAAGLLGAWAGVALARLVT